MNKSNALIKTSIISIITSLIATGIASIFSLLKLRDIPLILIAFLFLAFAIYFFLWRREIMSYGINSIDEPHTSLDMNLQMENCQKNFDFFGVSARTILDAQGGQTIKKKVIDNPNVKIRFLLLDPNEDEIGKKRAQDETGNENDWTAWKQIISASIDELKTIKADINSANIEVRVYSETPIFRAITIDEETMYLNYYGKGFRPSETPNLSISKKDISIFNALEANFNRVWNSSKVML